MESTLFSEIGSGLKGLCTTKRVVVLAIIAVVPFLLIVNSSWKATPDSALYLELGESLAGGRGYLFNGEPHTYVPPGFPSIVAVAAHFFGKSFLTYRALMALIGLLTAGAGYLLIFRLYGPDLALLVGGIFAINHVLLHNSTFTASDVPFAFFGICALNAVLSAARNPALLRWTILAALVSGIPPLIRINGVGLLAAVGFFLFCAWKDMPGLRRAIHTGLFLFLGSIPIAAWEIYKSYFPMSVNEGSYYAAITGRSPAYQAQVTLSSIWEYAQETTYALSGAVIKTGFLEWIIPCLILIGMWVAFRRRERLFLPMTVIQFGALFLMPAGSRYLILLIPGLYLFLALGLLRTSQWVNERFRVSSGGLARPASVLVSVFLLLAVLNLGHNLITVFHARTAIQPGGAESVRDLPYFKAAFWLRKHASNDVVMSMHPRVLHYLSGRPTIELIHSGVPLAQTWVRNQLKLQHLITSRKPAYLFSDAHDRDLFKDTVTALQSLGMDLEAIPEADASPRFRLWKIVPRLKHS
ncbi:MAG: phospholipid carrier-dependent glycosyltransferase [Desulfomonilaceae bacterium]